MAGLEKDEAKDRLRQNGGRDPDEVDVASEDSFPSSDPPSYTPVTGVHIEEAEHADGFASNRIGKRLWAIPEGHLPARGHGPEPDIQSPETVCILNAGEEDAHVTITAYFDDRDPAGPYRLTVPARRTRHVRFNELADPEPIVQDKDFASVIESDRPIVVQHTRLDSRQSENASKTTMAWSAE